MIKNYSDIKSLKTFDDRFKYLQMNSQVGKDTFGFDRYINQNFYKSQEWKRIRDHVILRDNGCDLGISGREIYGKILIHHMNPISSKDIENSTEYLLNPEYLICVSQETHNAIHYGDEKYLEKNKVTNRTCNDTCPWKK